MQVTRATVDIILPPSLHEASAAALKLCELFIGGLLSTNSKTVSLSVDVATMSVSCSEQRLGETVRLFLGAGRIDEFVNQLTLLLHESQAQGAIGELHCVYNKEMRRFVLFEISDSKLDWKIVSERTGKNGKIRV